MTDEISALKDENRRLIQLVLDYEAILRDIYETVHRHTAGIDRAVQKIPATCRRVDDPKT